jgi:hypothetical protein
MIGIYELMSKEFLEVFLPPGELPARYQQLEYGDRSILEYPRPSPFGCSVNRDSHMLTQYEEKGSAYDESQNSSIYTILDTILITPQTPE